ncbi:MAG TPA: DUF4136 domain-containing protein [Vicinamibacterales bacterium]
MFTPHDRRSTQAAAWLRPLALLCVSALLAGCATLKVNSYLERGADLSRYRTFDWGARDTVSTGDPRLDNNPFFENRVKTQVESALAARGFAKAARPDVTVHYHASVTQRIDISGIDGASAQCEAPECRPFVHDAGTLVVDLVDPATGRVVWRGWADGTLEGAIDNQRWMEERIDEAVAKILARLPPRP